MFTQKEIEAFADWIIAQENKMMVLRYPKPKECKDMTDRELLETLGVKCD